MRINCPPVNHHYMVCYFLILLNSSDLSKVVYVTEDLQSRLERLEMLHSEQDYTLQALNDTIAQQDLEITRLKLQQEQIQRQLQSLRSEQPGEVDSGFEPPPHY
jgi:uncharacterized coiled-coil protein SlyX